MRIPAVGRQVRGGTASAGRSLAGAYESLRGNYFWAYHFLFLWAEGVAQGCAEALTRAVAGVWAAVRPGRRKHARGGDAAQRAVKHRRQASLQALKEQSCEISSVSDSESLAWIEAAEDVTVRRRASLHQYARALVGTVSEQVLDGLRVGGAWLSCCAMRVCLRRGPEDDTAAQEIGLMRELTTRKTPSSLGGLALAGGTNLATQWSFFDGFGMFWPPRSARAKKTLVLDLDETLVHSQFKRPERCDVRLEVTVDAFPTVFFVNKRPHVDVFLRTVSLWYTVIIFTASLRKYADPLIDAIDAERVVKGRYFRESCVRRNGTFVKDLSVIEPDLARVVIVDNSPAAYSIQTANAVPVEGWYDDPEDEELLNLLPLLYNLSALSDVRSLLSLRTTNGLLNQRLRPGSLG